MPSPILVVSEKSCVLCGAAYTARAAHARYCSEACRYKAKLAAYHQDDDQRARAKERFRRWYAANRDKHVANTTQRKRDVGERPERALKKDQNPWVCAAPVYSAEYLPGGVCTLETTPPTKFEHRHLRMLHGLITALTGDHDQNIPRFALVPAETRLGWSVWLSSDEMAAFAGSSHAGRLGPRRVTLTAGPLERIAAPPAPERRRYRVRIDAVTPVLVRNNNSYTNTAKTHTAPTTGNLHSTLTAWLPRRIGLTLDAETVRLELVDRDTFPEHVPVGKVGGTRGWLGSCVVEVNAPGLWLLRVAECIGLGGRCAFGFGRIRVTGC